LPANLGSITVCAHAERAKLMGAQTVWSELHAGAELALSRPYTAPGGGPRSWLAEKFANLSANNTKPKS